MNKIEWLILGISSLIIIASFVYNYKITPKDNRKSDEDLEDYIKGDDFDIDKRYITGIDSYRKEDYLDDEDKEFIKEYYDSMKDSKA